MIRVVEALNFSCLRYVRQELGPFHILVGPNASGKTTFLDAIAFLGDLVSKGLEETIRARTQDLRHLLWRGSGDRFELALELQIPEERRRLLEKGIYDTVRYEIGIGLDDQTQSILGEKVLLKVASGQYRQRTLFPESWVPPQTILTPQGKRKCKTVVNKVSGGNDNFYDETGKGWDHAFKLGPRKSALANLPDDESKFPVATWLKGFLMEGIQRLVLNSALMRKPSDPGQPRAFRPDGSNLPWTIQWLIEHYPDRHREWASHLRTALPDLEDIQTIERPEDRRRYLIVRYKDKLHVPSWMVSDGTLRLLALTLPAYLPQLQGLYLVEEPENGIHPRAVETMFDSLSSVYDAQVLLASHSPVIVSVAKESQVLCFGKTDEGATDIVLGSDHPALRDWKGETNLGVLFAGGVLG